MYIRRSNERGYADHGWLKSFHSFSFAEYYDPRFMGFNSLRVINEDRISPASGFGTHPHNNMEILTYVIEGELTHEDSLGHKEKLRPGEIQVMSAGNGIRHSEYNENLGQQVHLLQIWIRPESLGGEPSYQQVDYTPNLKKGEWLTLVSPQGQGGITQIKQKSCLKLYRSDPGQLELPTLAGKAYWLQVVKGQLEAQQSEPLGPGDALAFEGIDLVPRLWKSDSEVELLLFEFAQ